MAWIWFMGANFAREEHARAFAEHFVKTGFSVPHAGHVELRFAVEQDSENETGWEVHVLPYVDPEGPDGVSHGGPWHLNGHGHASEPGEVEDIDACAKVLYERLASLHNYRFALVGFEVGGWRTAGGLLDDLSPGGLYDQHRAMLGQPPHNCEHVWDGLVISQDLWRIANRPEGFVRFSSDHLWVPYTTIRNIP
jgi:hypothetical protein